MNHFIIDISGLELNVEDRELLRHPAVAGIILFTRNYESLTQLKSLTRELRKLRSPLIIAVDQEGGRVQRFLNEFTTLPAMRYWGEQYVQNPERAKMALVKTIKIMTHELMDAGINVNLTPVLDIDHGKSAIIGERSFHREPQVVAELAKIVVETLHQQGMPAIGKHFPGHGAVIADSHHDLPIDERDWNQLEAQDLLPFVALHAQLDGIMPAHIVFNKLHHQPASFSSFWLKNILRERLHFQGVVISDDLSMKGAASLGGYAERAALALAAGCDLLLICNNRAGVIEVLDSKIVTKDANSQYRVRQFIQHLK